MKNKILVIIFVAYIGIFSVLGILIPDKEISNSERRKLKTFPEFEFNSEWISEVDGYLLDHFVLRDEFRSIKALYNFKVLGQLDNNGIYLKDNYIFKSNYPTNKKSINNFIDKINKLNSLLSKDNKAYMMIIPDKNYYLESDDFLGIDYDYIYKEVNKLGFRNIELRDILELSDYYETDTHWRQEKLDKVVNRMDDSLDFNYEKTKYKENKYDKFYGVYYGESAINRKPEELVYLTNDVLDNVTVKYLENDKLTGIYNVDKLDGMDSYDVYLDGASSFIEITNNNSITDKELVIFRDSFGSSLSPLLVKYYEKITLIDNRYISSDNFKDLIEFNNQDILFMYSTLFINDSSSLKG
ncbi:MAG: hypothetical protein IJE53_03500 [Bacilli bacterium]|nr:hypothetical protein [Bacilli bacterium]